MNLKKIQNVDLKNKNILLRVDFNVMVKDGKAREKFRIAAARKTIDHILKWDGVKLALLSHWGRPAFTEITRFEKSPGGKSVASVIQKYSLSNLRHDIEEILGIKTLFVADCVGEKVKSALQKAEKSQVLLLENVRLRSGDEINDPEYARQLAENFDVFVNEAFSVCHRDQASVTGIANILPAFSGLRLQQEVKNLKKVKENPIHPAVAIIGGAKIETKLPLIRMLERNYDSILVGGRVAIEAQNSHLSISPKVILPLDYTKDKKDIGPETIKKFKEVVRSAKTIVWNGPLGKFEEPPNDEGTLRVLEVVAASGAFSVVGGGESLQVLEEQNLLSKISFVSTGGGAMLEFMSGNDLPGLQCLVI